MKKLYIYGAGGLGKEVLSLVRALPEWMVAGFFDDGVARGTMIHGIPVMGGKDALVNAGDLNLVVALGDPASKAQFSQWMTQSSIHFPILVHPSVILQDRETISLGDGSIICAGCILTTDIHVGRHVLINLNATIGHDARVGDFTSIMPGVNVAGHVTMGREVLVGAGANVINNLKVGNRGRIGAGAVVVADVPENATVVGVPAKPVIRKP